MLTERSSNDLARPTWHISRYLTYPGIPWSRPRWMFKATRSNPIGSPSNRLLMIWNQGFAVSVYTQLIMGTEAYRSMWVIRHGQLSGRWKFKWWIDKHVMWGLEFESHCVCFIFLTFAKSWTHGSNFPTSFESISRNCDLGYGLLVLYKD